MDELESFVNDFESNYSGDITQSFFIGRGSRLLRIETRTDIRYDDERIGVRVTMDFGASAQDRWTMNVTVSEGSDRNTLRVIWKYDERTSAIENSLSIEANGNDALYLKLLWSPKNGDFRLTVDDGWSETEITGGFTSNDSGFHIKLDDLNPNDDEYIAFGIDAVYGAKVNEIEYINLDRWGETLIEKFEGLMDNLLRSGIF